MDIWPLFLATLNDSVIPVRFTTAGGNNGLSLLKKYALITGGTPSGFGFAFAFAFGFGGSGSGGSGSGFGSGFGAAFGDAFGDAFAFGFSFSSSACCNLSKISSFVNLFFYPLSVAGLFFFLCRCFGFPFQRLQPSVAFLFSSVPVVFQLWT